MKFKQFKFKKVKSTNSTAIRIIKSSNSKYGMVISDTQTMGRGQYGKKWISNKGNLFVSFLTIAPILAAGLFPSFTDCDISLQRADPTTQASVSLKSPIVSSVM